MKIIALLVAIATVDAQDYGFEKRGGDARFATGVMGAGFNRISKFWCQNYTIKRSFLD